MTQHPIVHIEISALDRKDAGEFYERVFGWKINDIPEMNYTLFVTTQPSRVVVDGGAFLGGSPPKNVPPPSPG